MPKPRQLEHDTVIYPLYAAKLYLDETNGISGNIETSIINGVKVSFTAHTHKGEVYRATTATVYAVDFYIALDSIKAALEHNSTESIELSSISTYGNARRESTISFNRSEAGIWSIALRATDRPAVKIEFKGIRYASHSVKGVSLTEAELSARHFKAWLKILDSSLTVAMAIHAHSNERVLLPREQPL